MAIVHYSLKLNCISSVPGTHDKITNPNYMQPAVMVTRWDTSKKPKFEINLTNVANITNVINNDMNAVLQTKSADRNVINSITNKLSNVIIDCANRSGMVRKIKKHNGNTTYYVNPKRTSKWFNEDCTKNRHEFAMARRRYKANKCDTNLRLMQLAGKQYKSIINKSMAIHHNTFLDKLKSKAFTDPKTFWKMLNKPRKDNGPCAICIDDFFDHFSKLNSSLTTSVNDIVPDSEQVQHPSISGEIEDDILNSPITDEEIIISIKTLKNGKACGIDNITNEMIKCFSVKNVVFLRNLFNMVFQTGTVPQDWLIGIIKPIYKNKGNRNDPDNYRGITLLSCICKLFTSIINNRLTIFFDSNEIISEAQAGFRKGYSTIDHIYTLKCIVDAFLCQGRLLFCTFVDYNKAFDSINRAYLWKKLLSVGVTGKVFNIITNMYRSIKSCVMVNGDKSDYFYSHVGVRQGENLSPILFALFLNDIESFSLNMKCNSLNYINNLYARCNGDNNRMLDLFLLLYADDTVVMAESESGLQNNLDILKMYCDANDLKVNMTKTKVLVFSRSKIRLCKLRTFIFGKTILEQVYD